MLKQEDLEKLKELQTTLKFIEEKSGMTFTFPQKLILNELYDRYVNLANTIGWTNKKEREEGGFGSTGI